MAVPEKVTRRRGTLGTLAAGLGLFDTGWLDRRMRARRAVRVAADRGVPVLHSLVAGTARQLDVPVPDQVWVAAGCAVRAEGLLGGRRTRLVVGAAPLLVLPPAELRALVARSLAAYHAGRPRWDADEAMTRVVSGWTAAAALLHLAVVEQRFALYLAACVDPLAGARVMPSDLYAGWRRRYRDETGRAVYTAGFDLDGVEDPDQPLTGPPLRERLARLTPDVGHLPLFPTAWPAVDAFSADEDATLSRTARVPGPRSIRRVHRIPWSAIGDRPYRDATARLAAAVYAATARIVDAPAGAGEVIDLYAAGRHPRLVEALAQPLQVPVRDIPPSGPLTAVLAHELRGRGYAGVSPLFPARLRAPDGATLDVPDTVWTAMRRHDYATLRALT
ncbi:MAG: hypothetical protein ACJ73S_04520 [Mycobacteriales bacterium]